MTAIATLPVLLQTGTHGARPAASAVGSGALYFCTTHNLIYQQISTAWGTFWTFSTGFTDPMTTRGDIIIRDASNTTARLGIGSSGKVLTSDGTDISWQTPAGGSGALIYLTTLTGSSSATLDFTSLSSSYHQYRFDFNNILPATDSVQFLMRVGTGGGPTYDTGTNYNYANLQYVDDGASTGLRCATAGTSFELGNAWNNTANQGGSGTIIWNNPASGASYPRYTMSLTRLAAGSEIASVGGGRYKSTTAITGIRFLFSSGNIASGEILCYGIKNS